MKELRISMSPFCKIFMILNLAAQGFVSELIVATEAWETHMSPRYVGFSECEIGEAQSVLGPMGFPKFWGSVGLCGAL